MSNQKIVISPENPEGILVDLTAEEISQRETDRANAQAEADAKAGNDKLIALGLSQDEVTAMTGYTIPVVSEEE